MYAIDSKKLLAVNVDFFEKASHSYLFELDEPVFQSSDSVLVLKYLKNQETVPADNQFFTGSCNGFNLRLSATNFSKKIQQLLDLKLRVGTEPEPNL